MDLLGAFVIGLVVVLIGVVVVAIGALAGYFLMGDVGAGVGAAGILLIAALWNEVPRSRRHG